MNNEYRLSPEMADHKSAMEKKFDTEGHLKANLLYKYAWHLGRMYGWSSIETYYEGLVKLIR